MTPFYDRDGITIFCGETIETMARLNEPFGVVITDPPYGISHPTNYKSRGRGNLTASRNYPPVHGDDSPFNPSPWLKFPCILWGANYYAHLLPPVSGWLVWDKERPDDLDQATCELAWSNFVKGVRRFRFLWNGCMRADSDALVHPTQKPVALMQWCLQLKWTPGGTILDPYMGSGTTLVAAQREGRRAVGIEISEDYCKIAVERLRQRSMFQVIKPAGQPEIKLTQAELAIPDA